MDSHQLATARRLLAGATRVFVLTGAGLSAEAGLPTYRGRNGLWSQVDPRKFTSPDTFEREPRTFWELCAAMREQIAGTGPSAAHLALARAALDGRRLTLVTQNVDGLHDRAAETVAADDPGAARAAEIHGNLWRMRCLECGDGFEHRRTIDPQRPPRCPRCDGRVRPDIVWFGEQPHRAPMLRAIEAAGECEVCMVIGTSALVAPASKLPAIAASRGAALIEINPQPTPLSGAAAATLRSGAGEALAVLL